MSRSYAAELLKLVKRPAAWIVVAVWLALMMLFTEVFPYLAYRSATNARQASGLLNPLLPAQVATHAISGYPIWGGALILVLGALASGSEYSWGSLKTVLANGPGRLAFYGSQLLALATAVAVLVLVAFVLCTAASLLVARSTGSAADLPPAWSLLRSVGAGWLMLMMWCLLGASLAIVFRGTALAIGLGLVWILALENLVRFTATLVGALAALDRYLPGADAGSLASSLGTPASGSTGVAAVVGGTQALVGVLLYALVFTGAGAAVLARRDVQ